MVKGLMGNEAKEEIKGFDFRTHIVDPATGKLLKHQPYRMTVDREKGTRLYRDGKCFFEDGTPDPAYLAPKPPTAPEAKASHDKKSS
jgi:hypothetical protein